MAQINRYLSYPWTEIMLPVHIWKFQYANPGRYCHWPMNIFYCPGQKRCLILVGIVITQVNIFNCPGQKNWFPGQIFHRCCTPVDMDFCSVYPGEDARAHRGTESGGKFGHYPRFIGTFRLVYLPKNSSSIVNSVK